MAIYMWRYVASPGIYWSSTLGLISLSSDGTTRITIGDKNLGATSTDITSTDSYGYVFQYGNNHGWTYTEVSQGTIPQSSTRVDISQYSRQNPYNVNLFITQQNRTTTTSSSGLNDLWGSQTNTVIARRGPCEEGWHIGNKDEWDTIFNMGESWGLWKVGQDTGVDNTNFKTLLNMPEYYLWYSGSITTSLTQHTATMEYYYSSYAINSYHSGSRYDLGYVEGRMGYATPIRPFKNEAVIPDGTWTVLYQPS